MNGTRVPLALLALGLAVSLLGCAGRSVTTSPPAEWQPPVVVDAACRNPPLASETLGWPAESYKIAVLIQIDADGKVESADVVDRWPESSWTRAADRPWEERELDWVRRQWHIEPARWGDRPVRSSILRVLTAPHRRPLPGHLGWVAESLGPPPPSAHATEPKLLAESLAGGVPAQYNVDRPHEPYTASVLLRVGKGGKALSAEVVSRSPENRSPFAQPWEEAWLEWMRDHWRFEPATRDGKPTRGQLLRVLKLHPDSGLDEVLTIEESVERGRAALAASRRLDSPASARVATAGGT